MGKRMSKGKSSANKNKPMIDLKLLPVSIAVFLVPLIVNLKIIDPVSLGVSALNGTGLRPDFFSYYKMTALVILAAIAVLTAALKAWREKGFLKDRKLLVLSGAFILLSVVSAVLSAHGAVAVLGYLERHEGLLSIVSYMALFLSTAYLVRSEAAARHILYPLMASAFIVALIGFFQLLGFDLFQSRIGRMLIIPGSMAYARDSVTATLGDNVVYSTLFHYNYVGSYMSMLLPIAAVMAIFERDMRLRVFTAVTAALVLIDLFACQSRAGIVGIALAALFVIVILRKRIARYWKMAIPVAAILIVGTATLNYSIGDKYENRISVMFSQLASLIAGNDDGAYRISGLVQIDDKSIGFEATDASMTIMEKEGIIIAVSPENHTIYSYGQDEMKADQRYAGYRFVDGAYMDEPVLELYHGDSRIYFTVQEGSLRVINYLGDIVKVESIDHIGFEGNEQFASSRGYIWSRTLPMIIRSPLAGYGPDTFALEFPQGDIAGKITAYGTSDIIVDKPHNMYIGIAVNSGIPSLLAFVGICALFLYRSLRNLRRLDFGSHSHQLLTGLTLGIIAYLGAGLFNDSVVSVAPVFWILLGTGFAVNYSIEADKARAV